MQRLSLPESVPSELTVWQLEFDFNATVDDDDYRLMSKDELQRVYRLRNQADVVRSVVTRATLRRLLSEQTGIAADKLVFTENDYGKPGLRHSEGPAFNVSHSGSYALIAIATHGGVGIDIECWRPEMNVAELAALVLSPSEQAVRHDEVSLPFIERWVVKEAVLKALGLGITEHLQALSVLSGEETRTEHYRLQHACPDWPGLDVWALEAPAGYVAALAHAGQALGGHGTVENQESGHEQ